VASLRRVLAVATPLALAVARGGAEQAVREPVFPSETRLVVLQATVKNGRGELVTNLGREAFTLYEDGKAQPISVFRADDVPVSLGLLIDNSGSMRRLRAKVEEAALACVRASNHDDEVFVLNFADKASIDVPMTPMTPMRPMNDDVRALEDGIARLDSIGGTAMRDAIEIGSRYLNEHARRDRRVLLLITDGNDNASVTPLEEIRRRTELREIAIYAIGLLRNDHGRHELDELAEATGGAAYFPGEPGSIDTLEPNALEIARQIRSQYTIAYTPSHPAPDGSYRKLRVDVRGSGLTATTRAGYRMPRQPRPGESR